MKFMRIIFYMLGEHAILISGTSPTHAPDRGFLYAQRGMGIK